MGLWTPCSILGSILVIIGTAKRGVCGFVLEDRGSTTSCRRLSPRPAVVTRLVASRSCPAANDDCTRRLLRLSQRRQQQQHHQQQRGDDRSGIITSTRLTSTVLLLDVMPFRGSTALVAAASTLLVAASAGYWSETKLVPNAGILITLGLALVASNVLRLAPTQHALYDACWSTVLPATLALLLLSLPNHSRPRNGIVVEGTTNASVWTAVKRLAIPFALASIGSVLGCVLSFAICYRHPTVWLTPAAASQAAACVAASFIGGSVNFFATAAILSSTSAVTSTLVSAMAAADIVVMALYFAVLSSALQSKRLQRLFDIPVITQVTDESNSDQSVLFRKLEEESGETQSALSLKRRTLPATLLVGMLAFGLVETAKRFESWLSRLVPGTACAFLAMTIPILTRSIPSNLPLWNAMQSCAEPCRVLHFCSCLPRLVYRLI